MINPATIRRCNRRKLVGNDLYMQNSTIIPVYKAINAPTSRFNIIYKFILSGVITKLDAKAFVFK